MSAQALRDTEAARENSATLRLRNGPLAAPVLCRVVAMMLARADCPVDRLDDAMLICDALSAHAHEHSSDGRLEITLRTDADGIAMHVAPLKADGAKMVVEEAVLPGVGNVIRPIADRVRIESRANGEEELVIAIGFARARDGKDAG